ncbi:unnamed protein product [Allacma fusca]|uniref:Uncharacterized protein n=1 Tax=Allacma fusca TaxID=39272 RepID=A0A8J2KDV9_9HEXA|nr:unnamed protein product [Allacma fusca]
MKDVTERKLERGKNWPPLILPRNTFFYLDVETQKGAQGSKDRSPSHFRVNLYGGEEKHVWFVCCQTFGDTQKLGLLEIHECHQGNSNGKRCV